MTHMGEEERDSKLAVLRELREKHGFKPPMESSGIGRFKEMARKILAGNGSQSDRDPNQEQLPKQVGTWPKNAPLLDHLAQKFACVGFSWEAVKWQTEWQLKSGEIKTAKRSCVRYTNYPKVGGVSPTLLELFEIPVDLVDGYRPPSTNGAGLVTGVGKPDLGIRPRMNETGIGYKGMDGISWRVGAQPFALPTQLETAICRIGDAVMLLADAVAELYGHDAALTELLCHKAPPRIPRLMDRGSTYDVFRPDMVIVKDQHGLRCVITELESCPAGHGMLYTMQHGYGLPSQMVNAFVDYLCGRPYLVFATRQWSEYVFEQAAFCDALRKRGVNARILFDCPLTEIAEIARRWQCPQAASAAIKATWDTDVLCRLRVHGFHEFVHGIDTLPASVGNAVVFRFGYFDNFSPETLQRLGEWQDRGARIVNPLQYPLESKALMAAAWLLNVERWITARDPEAVAILHRSLAQTRLLAPDCYDSAELTRDRAYWLTKFAAWDGGNQSWGSRSLDVGSQCSAALWERSLKERLQLPHPVVAQHVIASAQYDVDCLEEDGSISSLADARTRLTPFLMRGPNGKAVHAGSMITLRADTFRIHGATDAVEMPVVFTQGDCLT